MVKKISILKNGPYEVTGDIPMAQAIIDVDEEGISQRWKEGRKYSKQEVYHLCRCGASEAKPYCDGMHAKINFDGEEKASHGTGPVRKYIGAEVDMIDEEGLCASMRFCDRGPRTWKAAMNSDIPGYKELAIQEACDCAAGRLTVVEKDGTVHEPKLEKEIGLIYDTAANRRGPIWVKGGIPIEGSDGKMYKVRNRVTLCRCGKSKNMPFCDTSHFNVQSMKGKDD